MFEICGYTAGNYLTPNENSYLISHKTEISDLEYMEKIDVSYKINLEFIQYHEDSVYTYLGQTIKFEKELNQIKYFFSTKDQKYNFKTDLEINDTPFKIDFINYKKK
mgnify:CR=1 FL=1